MISVHRLNGSEFYINCHQIETMEETPDTIIHLVNEKMYIVKESADEILEKIVEYNRNVLGKKDS